MVSPGSSSLRSESDASFDLLLVLAECASKEIEIGKGNKEKIGRERTKRVFPPITTAGYEWVHGEVASVVSSFRTQADVERLLATVPITTSDSSKVLHVEPCGPEDQVFLAASPHQPTFTYLYALIFEELGVTLPFSSFECAMLKRLNVAPSQLHPNSWGFLRCFQIICRFLGIEPTPTKLMYFYQLKCGSKVKWVSLNGVSHAHGCLFKKCKSSYKYFKEGRFRLSVAEDKPRSRDLFFDSEGQPLFPFYWQRYPTKFKSVADILLTPEEREDLEILKQLPKWMSCRTIIHLPGTDRVALTVLDRLMAPLNWRALRKNPAITGEAPLQLNLGNTGPRPRKKIKVSKGPVSMPVAVTEVSKVSAVISIPTSPAFVVSSAPVSMPVSMNQDSIRVAVRTTQVTVPISPLPPPPVHCNLAPPLNSSTPSSSTMPSSSQPWHPSLMQRYDSSVPLTGLDHVSFSPDVRSLWSAHFSASDILPSDVLISEADRTLMEMVGPEDCFRSAETFLMQLMGMMRYHASNMTALVKTTQVEASKVARPREILNVEHDKHLQALVAFSASVKSNMTLSARVQDLIERFSYMRREVNNLYEKLATTEVEREVLAANLEEVNKQHEKLYAEIEDMRAFGYDVEKLEKENNELKKENDELKATMLEAKRSVWNEHKRGFEKAVCQSLLFHPEVDVQRFDLYKDVVDGELMNESDIEYEDEDNHEEE